MIQLEAKEITCNSPPPFLDHDVPQSKKVRGGQLLHGGGMIGGGVGCFQLTVLILANTCMSTNSQWCKGESSRIFHFEF